MIIGGIADQLSYERVLAPITFLTTLFCLFEGFAVNFTMFMIGSIGVHFFYGAYYPICLAYISHILPRKQSAKWVNIGVQMALFGKVAGAIIVVIIIFFI